MEVNRVTPATTTIQRIDAGIMRLTLGAGAVFFLIGLLFIRFDLPEVFVLVSSLFIVLLALPSYISLLRWLGVPRGLSLLIIFSLLPLMVEGFAVSSGFPYGPFFYSTHLGEPIAGLVPWTVAFAYLPILLGALTLACRPAGKRRYLQVGAGVLFLLIADLVIDPAAVYAGFWVWREPGLYYGIPLSNFLGWAFTGTLYLLLFRALAGRGQRDPGCPPPALASSLFLIVCLWTGFLIRASLLIPAVIGVGFAVYLAFFLAKPRVPVQ